MSKRADATAIAIFLAITCLFFLPVLMNPSGVFIGTFGDISVSLRTPAYINYNRMQGIQPDTYTWLLNAPWGTPLSQHGIYIFVMIYLAPLLAAVTTPLFTYNVLMFSGVLISAIAGYFLAKHFIKDENACFISGLVFGFSPYILARVVSTDFNMVHGGWLALFALALFRFNDSKNCLNAVLLALSLLVVGLFSSYYLYFAAIFAALFYIYRFWRQRSQLPQRTKQALSHPFSFLREQRHYIIAAALFLALFSLTILPILGTMLSESALGTSTAVLGSRANIMNPVYLSAWPHHFVTPSVYHPLFRPFIGQFLLNSLVGMTISNSVVFIGFTALALAFISLVPEKKDPKVHFFLFAAVCILILATGPFMRYIPAFGLTLTFVPALLAFYSFYTGHGRAAKIFAAIFALLLFFPLLYPLIPLVQEPAAAITGLEQFRTYSPDEVVEHLEKYDMLPIPMPSFFLFLAVPFFRSLARLDIVFMLCIALLAGFGTKSIMGLFPDSDKTWLIAVLFAGLILFEVINFPPYLVTDISQTPEEYQWLAQQPGSPIVLEYPLEWENVYTVYQLQHMKPLMNGGYSSKFKQLKKHILDPADSEALSILAGFGVRYIITHDDHFLEQIPPYFPGRSLNIAWMSADKSLPYARELDQAPESVAGLRLVKDFPHANVYEITAEPAEFEFN